MNVQTDVTGSVGHILIGSTDDPHAIAVTMYGSTDSVAIEARYDPFELLAAIQNAMNVIR